MGRGRSSSPHFYFWDIDEPVDMHDLMINEPDSLIYRTERGYHIISSKPISEYAKNYGDKKCPHNAVRIYPHDDYQLINRPRKLCWKAASMYEIIFGLELVMDSYLPCSQPLKFGIYDRSIKK